MVDSSIKISRTYEKFALNTVLHLFRYVSFAVTSVFFLVGGTTHSLWKRILIVGCICVSTILLNYLYGHYLNNSKLVVLLLSIETFLNACLLIPTGGLGSPYIWYSINTILIASAALKSKIYCWLNLLIYVFNSAWISFIFIDQQDAVMDVLWKESNLLLSLILVTGATQLLVNYSRTIEEKRGMLEKANHELSLANLQVNECMNATMELYRAVHLLTTQQDSNNLVNILLEFTMRITKARLVYFYKNSFRSEPIIASLDNVGSDEKRCLETELAENATKINEINTLCYLNLGKSNWLVIPVNCQVELYGVIGVEVQGSSDNNITSEMMKQMGFLSELSSMVFEKFELEQLNKRLLINEEQNRIANEIHDGVLQKLFSVSCGIFGLIKRLGSISTKSEADLINIQTNLNDAMGDLRSTIYGYSWKKNGNNNFLEDIHSLIDSIKRLHEIDIDFDVKGSIELLNMDHKTAFYRIISEGMGNAIRHGKASHISIKLSIGSNESMLLLKDNGTGFDLSESVNDSNMGIGLKNIKHLAQSLHGNVQMDSSFGKGMSIKIKAPIDMKSGFYKEGIL